MTVSDDSRRQVIVVSYFDGSGVKGVYGPYDSPEIAGKVLPQLQALPGMGEDKWEIFPLHEIVLRKPKDQQ
jgi:hypothetical protein